MEHQAGLFPTEEKNHDTAIEDAVTSMFAELEQKNLLTGLEKAKQAMLLKTARALDRGLASSKITVATANLLNKVMDVLDTLPRDGSEDNSMDAWDAAALDATASAMAAEADADLVPVPAVDQWTIHP